MITEFDWWESQRVGSVRIGSAPVDAVLATAVGIYLGLSLDYGGGRNLLIPIIIHAAYDFLAFVLIMKAYRESYSREEDEV